MKIKSPLVTNLGALLGSAAIRQWMGTLEYKAAFYDPTVDASRADCVGQKIYVFWHEYLLFPMYLRGHCDISLLVSRHRDGDVLSRTAYHFGYDSVRGSTSRGGATALRELMNKGKQTHLAITPDGPRGPRRQFAQGPVYLASRLQLPLVLIGLGHDQPWRTKSWDRFAVPRPFTRARAVFSPEIRFPERLDRDGLEHYRQQMENLLLRLTLEAESWAESGTRKLNEVPFLRQSALARPATAPLPEPVREEAPLRRCA